MRRRFGGISMFCGCAIFIAVASCSTGPKTAGSGSEAKRQVMSTASGRVAIFGFEVKGGGDAYASLVGDIPESLSEAFIKGGRVMPVERRDLEKVLSEQELALSGLVDEATAARVGALAGARYALLGSASIIDTQVRISCRLIDVETGEIVYAQSARGGTQDIYAVLDKLAAEIEDGFSK
jgi:TolB-like protein